jgi:hypothetical protein
VACTRNGLTQRHNALRDELSKILTVSGIAHLKEMHAQGRDRPADLLLVAWDKGRDLCVDLTITCPFTAENYPLSQEQTARHLKTAEKRKLDKHAASCTRMGWGAHPMAFSPWGSAGPLAKSMTQEILKRSVADLEPDCRGIRVQELRQNLSITLARSLARQLSLRDRVLEDTID